MTLRSALTGLTVTALLAVVAGAANAQPPAAPVRGVASGDVIGSDLSFTWSPAATSTWYHLMVQDGTGVKLNAWYTTAEAHCGAGEPSCSVRANVTLARGVVYWWVQAYSPAGYSPWSARGEFSAAGVLQATGGNTFLGIDAGLWSPTGTGNTGIGGDALSRATTGFQNTALGANALEGLTTGTRNTALGYNALSQLVSGDGNIGIGVSAGSLLQTGSNNIYIDNGGASNESNAIRIGGASHTSTAIGGIYGQANLGGVTVLINSTGRLGTALSSARYKEDIRDIGDATAALAKLRPVEFRYRTSLDPDRITQYGLIAEDVAQVWPELVVYDADGRPETVRYHLLVPLLLNELQRARADVRALAAEKAQQVATLSDRVAALEAAVAALAGRP